MEDPVVRTICEKYLAIEALLDERAKRIWAGAEARALGRGGVTRVMEATGMSRQRVTSGVKEIEASGAGGVRATGRVRAAGGSGSRSGIRVWPRTWRSWWIRRRGAIRRGRCGGRA